MAADRLDSRQRRIVAGVCVAAGAAYLQPATYNYIVNPMLITFDATQSATAPLREVPSIAALLVIFLVAVMAARFGQRTTMIAGSLLVLGGSVLVAAAPTLVVAVAGLSVQAVGATVLLVLPLAVIGATVMAADSRATAFAVFAMVSPIVFVCLPVLTSLLMQHFSWRVVAGIWALGAAAATIASRWALPADPAGKNHQEILTPTLAGLLCVGVVQSVAHASSEGLFAPATLVRLAIAGAAAVLLVVALRRRDTPSFDVGFLRAPGSITLLVVIALWCFTQLWYYMTLAYEYVFGLSVLVTALLMAPAQACAAIGARSAGWLVRRFDLTRVGFWMLMATGASLGLSVLVFTDSPLWWPVAVTCLYSFTSVAAGVPMTIAVMDTAGSQQEGNASAYRQAAISTGTAVGITVISALVFAVFNASLTQNLQASGQDTAQAQQIAADLRTGATTTQEAGQYAVPVADVEAINSSQQSAMLDGMAAHGWAGLVLSVATAGLFAASRRRASPTSDRRLTQGT